MFVSGLMHCFHVCVVSCSTVITSCWGEPVGLSVFWLQKGKQKSPGRATSRSRNQSPTPGGREKVTQINVCIANKQIHDKHKDHLPLPQAR